MSKYFVLILIGMQINVIFIGNLISSGVGVRGYEGVIKNLTKLQLQQALEVDVLNDVYKDLVAHRLLNRYLLKPDVEMVRSILKNRKLSIKGLKWEKLIDKNFLSNDYKVMDKLFIMSIPVYVAGYKDIASRMVFLHYKWCEENNKKNNNGIISYIQESGLEVSEKTIRESLDDIIFPFQYDDVN